MKIILPDLKTFNKVRIRLEEPRQNSSRSKQLTFRPVDVPEEPGVYYFKDQMRIVYIGQTQNLAIRIGTNHPMWGKGLDYCYFHRVEDKGLRNFLEICYKLIYIGKISEMKRENMRYPTLTITDDMVEF